jgi:hypothetical protein
MKSPLSQFVSDTPKLLRAGAMRDQNRVLGIDCDDIIYPEQHHQASARMRHDPSGFECDHIAANDLSIVSTERLAQALPRTHVVPAEACPHAEDAPALFHHFAIE